MIKEKPCAICKQPYNPKRVSKSGNPYYSSYCIPCGSKKYTEANAKNWERHKKHAREHARRAYAVKKALKKEQTS